MHWLISLSVTQEQAVNPPSRLPSKLQSLYVSVSICSFSFSVTIHPIGFKLGRCTAAVPNLRLFGWRLMTNGGTELEVGQLAGRSRRSRSMNRTELPEKVRFYNQDSNCSVLLHESANWLSWRLDLNSPVFLCEEAHFFLLFFFFFCCSSSCALCQLFNAPMIEPPCLHEEDLEKLIIKWITNDDKYLVFATVIWPLSTSV